MISDKEERYYELGFLIKTEEDAALVRKILTKNKAEIMEEGAIVKVRLAYPVKKTNQAFFGYYRWLAVAETLTDIERELKLASPVLRYLLIKLPKNLPAVKKSEPVSSRSFVKKKEKTPVKKVVPASLSNEALEKKIEEILNT